MVRGRNARNSDTVVDLPKNHLDQPLNDPSAEAPVVSAVGALTPLPIGVTIGVPPLAPIPPVGLTTGMETIQAW